MKHTEPVYADITPDMRERLEKFRQDHEGAPLGGVGSEVLFEDDNVKIWELALEPGEASPLHHHEHDYYLIIDSGDIVAAVMPEGSGLDFFVGVIPEQGNTVFVPKGNTEWAVNVGEKRYHEVLVELKRG